MSNILTGFNMQGNDPIDNRIVSPSKFETLEEYLQRVPIQKRYYGLSFYALDEDNKLRHYTFQTSLIEPTIDDDKEEIERLDKELQEHVNNKEIHKTSEEIRSEIVDADIPDTIARVQWTLDKIEEAVNTVMGDIVDGASDEYNTLKKIQDKIVELRAEMESQLYGDDGGEVLKTLEQALKFLNQYKDFIVDIPDNYVNKQDIVDNLNTDDPTKVLSARQGKVLSETLTNYFDSAMASIRAETNRATNAENRIEAKLDDEIDRSTAEDIRIQSELDAEEARAQSEEKRIEDKLDAEIERSTTKDTELGNQIIAETNRAEGEEQRIETKLDNEITRSTAKDEDHDKRIEALEGETHVQNTDVGTTSQTFQLQMGKPGNKIKNEDAAVSVRNADDSDYVNFIAKNATFKGDLIVEGQSFVTEAETVEIKDNILLLNKGEIGSGVTKGMAGLQIDRGTQPDFQILFVESDRRFKAGEEGNLQCLALRDEDGDMLDGMFTTWDSATHRLKTTNIIPSTRKLFFNTNANSLGYTSHVYDSTYTADSFTFTKEAGSLFFSAGTTNLNLDTDKTYFRFYKNLMIPSSIISSGTSISLLNASGATIATFGSPSTINSTLNVADQVIIKRRFNTKLIMQSTDADNHNLIESQNSSGTKLSTFGYYGTFWGIDGYSIATESWSNNKFLPLAGGTMTGVILMNNNVVIQSKNSSGTAKRLIGKGSDNVTYIGDSDGHTFLCSDAADIIHVGNGTSYRIWDASNLTSPLLYASGTAATPTIVYNRNLGVNGSQWTFLSATNAATTSIYAPTAAGTSGQVLTSTGGVPTWSNISSVGDSRYVLKSGDTMTGNLTMNGGWLQFSNNNWSDKGGAYKESEGSLKVWRVSTDAENKPSAYGSVLQINSRSGHWNTQLWIDHTNTAGNNGKLRYRSNKNYRSVEWNDWTVLATEDYVNSKAAGYLPLTGGTMSGFITFPNSAGIVQNVNETSDYVRLVNWVKGTKHYSGQIGYHSTGGDGNGAIIIRPYYDEADGWSTAKGLYISKGQLLIDGASVATQTWVSSQGFLKTAPSISITTSGSGNVVTGISASGHTLTVTKGSASVSVSWNDITGKPSSFTPSAHTHTYLSVLDNRSTTMLPNNNGSSTFQTFFNMTGMPSSGWYSGIWVNGWARTYSSWQLCGYSGNATPSSNSLYFRSGINSTWNSWKRVAFADEIPTRTSDLTNNSGFITSSSLSGYATQSWVTNQNYAVQASGNNLIVNGNEFNFTNSNTTTVYINYRSGVGGNTSSPISSYKFYNGQGLLTGVRVIAETFIGALDGNATTATTASKLGSSTVGSTSLPIYLNGGTPTACSATLGVSITGNAATATTASNSNNLGGYAAATYVKSTSTTKVSDIQVVTTAGTTTGVLYIVLES